MKNISQLILWTFLLVSLAVVVLACMEILDIPTYVFAALAAALFVVFLVVLMYHDRGRRQ